MNFLRRIYLLLLGLLLVIAVTLLLLSPQAVGAWVGSISELSPVLRVGLTIVIDLFLFALMYLQVRPDPGSNVNGLVMRGSGAITEVSVESARDRILKAVSDVPDVVSVEASVKPVRGRADIEMQVAVMGHDVKLPNKQKEINRALKQVIDKQLGLQMSGQPRIHIRIHGEETPKPSITPIPTIPDVARETLPTPAIAPLSSAPNSEPEPELKPSTGLFSGLGRKTELEESDEVVIVKPQSVKSEPEPTSNRLSDFLGGWRQDREEDQEDEIATPSQSAPDSIQEELPSPPLSSFLPESQSAVVGDDQPAKTEMATDEHDLIKPDLDEDFSRTTSDDLEADELEKRDDNPAAEEISDDRRP